MAVLFRFRTAHLFDPAAATLVLKPSFLGRMRGLCSFAYSGPLGCLADQTKQPGNSILTVLFLGAKPPGIDDKITFFGHTLSGQTGKAVPNVLGKGRRMGYIEAELNGRADLIDILPARAGSADELLMNLSLINRDRTRNSNHTFSVSWVGFSGKHQLFFGQGPYF